MLKTLENKRIAVVYEWWSRFGGGESTTLSIAEALPNCDLWTIRAEKGAAENLPSEIELNETWVRKIPFSWNKYLLATMTPLALHNFTNIEYQALISSSHTFAHMARLKHLQIPYLSYVHTPSRQIWLPDIDDRVKLPNRIRDVLQRFDRSCASSLLSLAANSENTRRRIQRFWNRDAEVIYPPVNVENARSYQNIPLDESFPFKNGEYLVSAGRLVHYKRHDIAIECANALGMPLVIMGSGPEKMILRKMALASKVPIHFVQSANEAKWFQVLGNAYALLFLGEEDFGITPIESICVGTPVVAFEAGGALEYIKHGVNGVFTDSLDAGAIARIVREQLPDALDTKVIKSVEYFRKSRFQEQVQNWILRNM